MPRALALLAFVLVAATALTRAAQRGTGATPARTSRPGWLPRSDTAYTRGRFTGSRVQLRALLLHFRIREVAREEQLDRPVIDSHNAFDWMSAARRLTPAAKR